MSDQDDLRLNELNRYRKTSSRLALEVHGSCEVPAGCGGAVLRWRRPGANIGLTLWTYASGLSHGPWIDGQRLTEQRILVSPGEHTLALIVDKVGKEGFLLLRMGLQPHIASALRPEVVSQADGRWRVALQEPPAGWLEPGFDDSGFRPLVEAEVPPPSGNERWSWEMLKDKARGLGLPSDTPRSLLPWRPMPRAWVRWTFRVTEEGFS